MRAKQRISVVVFISIPILFFIFFGIRNNRPLEGQGVTPDFRSPIVTWLSKALSLSIHLPLDSALLRKVSANNFNLALQVHNEIVRWHFDHTCNLSQSRLAGCQCGRISEPCQCFVILAENPFPKLRSLSPKYYRPLIHYPDDNARLNFNLTFLPKRNSATVSAFLNGSSENSQAVRIPLTADTSVSADDPSPICLVDQATNENRPQVSLCLSPYNLEYKPSLNTEYKTIFSWCANVTTVLNNRLISAFYPLGCYRAHRGAIADGDLVRKPGVPPEDSKKMAMDVQDIHLGIPWA